jgi:hypothetical protein
MKRFLMMITALAVISVTVNAQTGFTVGARLGPGFGFNELGEDLEQSLTGGTGGISIDEKSNIAFVAAVYGNYAFFPNIPKFSIQAELHFMVNNGMELSGGGAKIKGSFTSLDIPVLARYEFFETPISLSVLGGPYLSFPLGKLEIDDPAGLTGGKNERSIEGIRFGITVGAAAGYKLGPGNIVADLRFLTDFMPVQVSYYWTRADIFTRRGINLTVGYEMKF